MTQYWVTSRGVINAVAARDRPLAEALFGNEKAIALGGWPGAMEGMTWASHAKFAADLEAGAVPDTVKAVMYDPEAWEATPLPEKQDPVAAMRTFSKLARARGFFVVITPHPRLVVVPGAKRRKHFWESLETAYLRSGITAEAARNADAAETQAQNLQRDPKRYADLVERTAEQARQANSNVIVLSGLSTHPGYPATPEMLHAAWQSVRHVVDGHYLSLARGRLPEVAVAFLRQVAGSHLEGDRAQDSDRP
jgi:hypothetical protein